MRQYRFPKKKNEIEEIKYERWTRGLNQLVSATQIRGDEVSEMVDCQLVEDGKIQFPRSGQAYYGNSSGSKVTGLYPYYKSDGTKQLLRSSGTALQVLNTTTQNWDTVSGKTYTTTLDTNGVMAYDRLYLANGTDALTYYDGTSIQTFTAISAPTSPSVTRSGGSAGTYTYSYKVTAVTATGETLPTAAATANADVATLTTSVKMVFTWTAATSAIGYNVYGRKDNAWYFMKYLEGNGSVSFTDDGTLTPSELFTPPTVNTTAGPVGKYIEVYKDSLFIFGNPSDPSRLFYSGGGDKINDFSAANGGGFIDISKNDGQMGTGLRVYKNTLVCFKEDSIYQFSFSTAGAPQVQQVTPAVGCIAPRSILTVENDLWFCARRGVFSLGNEQGFVSDILRTREISARVRPIYQSIDQTRLDNIAGVYATKDNANLIIYSYSSSGSSYNDKALVYDWERQAWYRWTNIQANCLANYIDSSGNTHVLYGDDNSGYVKECLTGSDDFGSAISAYAYLKSEAFDDLARYKKIKDFSVVLRNPSGSANATLVADGTSTIYQSNVSTVSPSINWGHYLPGAFMPGESYGMGAVTSSDEIVLRTKRNINALGKSFQMRFDNGSSGASFTLLGIKMSIKPRSMRYRESIDLI